MRNLVLSSALLLLCACEKKETPASQQETIVKTTAQTPEAVSDPHAAKVDPHGGSADPHGGAVDPHAALPEGHPKPAAAESDAALAPPQAGGLTWTASAPFERRTPKSSMRVAEYGLAGSPQTELTVFYFGADQGGSVDANMTRWVGQFANPAGGEPKQKRSERKVKGMEVSLVEATGTYSGGMGMPGAPAAAEQADAMLLGAIAKGPQGSVFFKMVGPKKDVEGARKAFDALVDSLRPETAAK